MTGSQARRFLLKPESYCNTDLPGYFTFRDLLSGVSKELIGKSLTSLSTSPREHEGVNYSMLSNKDGRHAWRPLQLIHPALYVSLVDRMTSPSNWKVIRERFNEFQSLPNIKCLSMPVAAPSGRKDKAAQILGWWQGIEQGSIELAMEYGYMFHADIADCYADIYTHSIAWAIHTKSVAKAKKGDKTLVGNLVDGAIQDMRHGQTNGIPQGSVLMDFVAEIVLGYIDFELSRQLAADGIVEFQILRYRDDYRIFVQNPQIGERILKALTEVLIDLGLKLNSGKTTGSSQVVAHSLKPDKRAWFRGRQGDPNLQKHLLVIHGHGMDFPNAGSLIVALTRFHQRLMKVRKIQNPSTLISIAVDIAFGNPKSFPVCAAIISKLLSPIRPVGARTEVIRKIHRKLSQLPNTGHMEIWLQRVSHPIEPRFAYSERMCMLVKGKNVQLWNSDWITAKKLKAAVDPARIVNKSKLRALKTVVSPIEIALFATERY